MESQEEAAKAGHRGPWTSVKPGLPGHHCHVCLLRDQCDLHAVGLEKANGSPKATVVQLKTAPYFHASVPPGPRQSLWTIPGVAESSSTSIRSTMPQKTVPRGWRWQVPHCCLWVDKD